MRAVGTALLCTTLGWACTSPHVTRDSWYHVAPPPDADQQLAVEFVHVVGPSHQRQAQADLSTVAAIAVPYATACALAGESLAMPPDRSWYLLRGLTLHPGNPRFAVFEGHGRVSVHFFGMGRGADAMARIAVLAALREAPGEVEVVCTTAE